MSIGLREESASAVSTPSVGKQTLFIDISDGLVKKKLPDGSVEVVEASAFGVASFNGRVGAVAPSAADYAASQVVNAPAGNISATDVQNAIDQLDSIKLTTAHQGAGGSVHPTASSAAAGFMAPADKIKLDSLSASGAVSSVFGRTGAIIQIAGDYAASAISVTPAGSIISTDVQSALQFLDTTKAPSSHVGSGGVSQHAIATGANAGFMSPTDKSKLDGVAASATLNASDAYLLARANHTGTQNVSTITGLAAVATSGLKADVGLGSVDNTADTAKPVSVAQSAADAAVQAYSIQRGNHTGVQLASTISDFAAAASTQIAIQATPIAHVGSGGTQHAVATSGLAGFMSAADKGKLDGISASATQNSSDAYLLARANHTGTQVASTISDFTAAASAVVMSVSPPSAYVAKSGDTMTGQITIPRAVLNGASGNGYIEINAQTVTPETPTGAFRLFADSSARFSWRGTNGFVRKFEATGITADRTYALPDASIALMGNPMSASGDLIYGAASGTPTRLGIGNTDDILRVASGVPSWQPENLTQDFGDGSDGDLTVSGALTLSQIPYYGTLTLTAGAVINPAGYPIYCKRLDLSNAPAGAIVRNGNAGANSVTNAAGAAGTALTAAVLGGSGAGSAGAAGSNNAGVASGAAGSASPGNGGDGGNSGISGAGGTGAGVAAGAGGTAVTPTHFGRFEYQFLRGAALVGGGAGGDGGNSGGGDGANISRGGGGGGSGGGVVVIYAAEVITSVSTPAAVVQSRGGSGGSAAAALAAGNVGGSSGAGGGAGGYIYLAYVKRTGPAVSGLLDAQGGTGGNGGNAFGTGVGGNGGQGAFGGKIQTYNVTTGTGVLTTGVTGATGTVASGTTGGVGGNGGACTQGI